MPRRTYHRVGLGVDTLEVNAYGSLAEHMPPILDALQAIAIEERDEQHHRKARDAVRLETYWELRGQPLLIAPHGVGEGQFRWLITCPAAVFRVAQRNMNEIAVKVRLSSPFLWEYGYWQAWGDVRALLGEWGSSPIKSARFMRAWMSQVTPLMHCMISISPGEDMWCAGIKKTP